ncbi:Anaphase-promoting complex subunit 4 [Aphelenchoides besseyi]|nr:Anaphase-promoting complex subunit 4 [Aphelenchoides besseyi]
MEFYDTGITYDRLEFRTKFKVKSAVWNPQLDVLALASSDGEICLKRFYWKTGWKKKIASEPIYFNKWTRSSGGQAKETAGQFAAMCWSPCGRVLAVGFEEGICHLLEVNDALILYSFRLASIIKMLKWIEIDGLNSELKQDVQGSSLFTADYCYNSNNCEHLKTKESETQRDNYKIVYGLQEFCHSLVQRSLLGTALIIVAEADADVGFHVYTCGMFLTRSITFDYSFMNDYFDKSSLEVRDFVVLPNGNLQFAVSASAHDTPKFDSTAGYTLPESPEAAYGECTFLLDYDVGFANLCWMRSSALLAARVCHILHLFTSFRETFFRTCAEWENQFHRNVFGSLYEKYREETKGQVTDFALDFMSYILTGNSAEAFARAFFKDIKPTDWKAARDFVIKHIPNFLQSINRHLFPLVDVLYVHLRAFHDELQSYERNCVFGWNEHQRKTLELLDETMHMEKSPPLRQVLSAIAGVRHLAQIVQLLGDVAHKNWAELKYVLQLLSSHPDNEQLKMDIEDNCDGIPRQENFEVLLNFILNALVDPSKQKLLDDPFELIRLWHNKLDEGEELAAPETLLCNPNWLKHRVFDKIAPLLGICPEIPVSPLDRKETEAEEMFDVSDDFLITADCRSARTVLDALRWCFNAMEDIYLNGTNGLHEANKEIKPIRTACVEYCHPESITKLQLFNWDTLKQRHRSMKSDESEKCAQALKIYEENTNAKIQSMIMIHRLRFPRNSTDADEVERKTATTVQCFVSVEATNEVNTNLASKCAPKLILKLSEFGRLHECTDGFNDMTNEKIAVAFESGNYHVMDAEIYGSGAIHLVCSFCEPTDISDLLNSTPTTALASNGSAPAVYILRADICGNLRKVESTPLTYTNDPILCTASGRTVSVLFEQKYETIKWFDLEAGGRSLLHRPMLVVANRGEAISSKSLVLTPHNSTLPTTPTTSRPRPYVRPSARRRRVISPSDSVNSFISPLPSTPQRNDTMRSSMVVTPTSTGRHRRLRRISTRDLSSSSRSPRRLRSTGDLEDEHDYFLSNFRTGRSRAGRHQTLISDDEDEVEQDIEMEELEEMDEETRRAVEAGALVVEIEHTPTPSPTSRPSPISFRLRSRRIPETETRMILSFGESRDDDEREDAYDADRTSLNSPTITHPTPPLMRSVVVSEVQTTADGEILLRDIPSPVASTITASTNSSASNSTASSPTRRNAASTRQTRSSRRSNRRRFTAELRVSGEVEEEEREADLNDNELSESEYQRRRMREMLENLETETETAARTIAAAYADNRVEAEIRGTYNEVTRSVESPRLRSATDVRTQRRPRYSQQVETGSLRRSQRFSTQTTTAAASTSTTNVTTNSTSPLDTLWDSLENEQEDMDLTMVGEYFEAQLDPDETVRDRF